MITRLRDDLGNSLHSPHIPKSSVKSVALTSPPRFLLGGGQMGELTRNFDWSRTPVGEPHHWPASLRTTVSNLLRSKFPMFLWWGPEMTQFYNDAYRPSFGIEGKHPLALGQSGKECWPEIWDIIYPLLRQVELTGEATWMEDQLVPIYRNGKIEDVYWTFSYSAVLDDEGNHGGILVTCTETTNKVAAFRKLLTSEKRFQNLIRDATIGMVVLTGEEMVVEIVNEAYCQLIERTTEELTGKPLFDTIPEMKPHYNSVLEQVRISGQTISLYDQPYYVFSNGKRKERHLNLVVQPYREQDAVITGVMAMCQDVTEQVLSRRKIQETDERLKLSIQAAELGTFDVDLLTNEIITSKKFNKIFGVSDSTSRADIVSAIHPDDLELRKNAHKKSLETGILDYQARLIWKDGSIHWFHATGTVYFDADNKPVKLLGIVLDITEQKSFAAELERQVRIRTEELIEVQQSLVNANVYLQNIINLFREPLQVLEPVFEESEIVDFRYKLTNNVYAAYANATPEELENRKVGEYFPGYFQTSSFTNVVKAYNTGVPDTWELHYNVDGLDLYNQMSATKLGQHVVVHFTDFTRLKNLELELLRNIDELKRSNKNLEEFAYAASHDLKEPIRKVRVFADRIKSSQYANFSAEDRYSFERMEHAAQRMGSLIEDLLTYSQVSLLPSSFEKINLNDLVGLVLDDLDLEIEEKKAVVRVDPLGTANGHNRQLQQAFQNLILNALKYRKPDRHPEIHIFSEVVPGAAIPVNVPKSEQHKTYNAISIVDNGIGFDQKDAERIFNVFTRLHINTEYRGTGLGLSIVRKVIENHSGYIVPKSVAGAGSTFTMYLPLYD